MRLQVYPLLLVVPLLSNSIYETKSIHADVSMPEQIQEIIIPQSPASPRAIPSYSTAGLLNIVSSTQNCSDFIGASQEVVKRMKRDAQSELFLGLHDHVYILDEEREFTLEDYVSHSSFPFVLQSTSPYFYPLRKDLSEKEEISPEIYFIFTPSLLNCAFQKPLQNILGMTYGSEMIFVKNGSDIYSSLFPSIVAHELQHTKDQGKTLLEKETHATQRERDTLVRQKKSKLRICKEDMTNLSCSRITEYDARLDYIEKRLKSAEYLSKKEFTGAFAQVYPPETILSSSLLEANIPEPILLSYALAVSTRNPPKDIELMLAAEIAVFALQTPVEERLQRLQEMIDSPDREENEKRNAQAAFAFFSPSPEAKEKKVIDYPDPLDGNNYYPLSEEELHTHPSPLPIFPWSLQE